MRSLDYATARTIPEAVNLLHHPGARPLAGGTDLLVQLRKGVPVSGVADPLLVDIKAIQELRTIDLGENGLSIGAAVTCAELRDHPGVMVSFPALTEAAGLVGGAAIQNRATIGGNLCNASPSADTIPSILVCGGACNISGPEGGRTVAAADFCTGPGKTVLTNRELLTSISFSPPSQRSGAAYMRFTPRHEMDIAVAGAAVWLQLDSDTVTAARCAFGAVGPTPLLLTEVGSMLTGKAVSGAEFQAAVLVAARAAAEMVTPIDDVRGREEQRRHLIEILFRRVTQIAVARAQGTEVKHG